MHSVLRRVLWDRCLWQTWSPPKSPRIPLVELSILPLASAFFCFLQASPRLSLEECPNTTRPTLSTDSESQTKPPASLLLSQDALCQGLSYRV
uniref:Macaca fascicularis brain cDNA, clone: QflA-21621 n=1 Tax=Macaca fascicularis TaxID=9541 RepID=I7GNN1_MACFA|nr:unnamed protein product [Macaca fascicularis]